MSTTLAACGSLAEDTPDRVDFALPTSVFSLTSDAPDWVSSSHGVPNMVCAGAAAPGTDCCSPPDPWAATDCEAYPLVCHPKDNVCALSFAVHSSATIHLAGSVREIAEIHGRILSSVVVKDMQLAVTLTPPELPVDSFDLYVGPAPSAGADGTAVRWIASVPRAGAAHIALGEEEGRRLSAFATAYHTPFSLWLVGRFLVTAGSSAAEGRVDATLTAALAGYY